jgi:hypothetical protein
MQVPWTINRIPKPLLLLLLLLLLLGCRQQHRALLLPQLLLGACRHYTPMCQLPLPQHAHEFPCCFKELTRPMLLLLLLLGAYTSNRSDSFVILLLLRWLVRSALQLMCLHGAVRLLHTCRQR